MPKHLPESEEIRFYKKDMKKEMVAGVISTLVLVMGLLFTISEEAGAQVRSEPHIAYEPEMVMSNIQLDALKVQPHDNVMGDENAPLTIVEYASMTCPHCSTFHRKILPQLKKEYIDTGKVKLIFRELAWDNLARAISKISRCAPKDQYFNFVSVYFSMQERWRKKNPMPEIYKIARLGGMSEEDVNACIADPEVDKPIDLNKTQALDVLKVKATPTLFIGTARWDGLPLFSELQPMIEAELSRLSAN